MPYPSPHEKKQERLIFIRTMIMFLAILAYAFIVGALIVIIASS